jgi:hypothetical protein
VLQERRRRRRRQLCYHRVLCCVATKQTKEMLKGGCFPQAPALNPAWVPFQALQLQQWRALQLQQWQPSSSPKNGRHSSSKKLSPSAHTRLL